MRAACFGEDGEGDSCGAGFRTWCLSPPPCRELELEFLALIPARVPLNPLAWCDCDVQKKRRSLWGVGRMAWNKMGGRQQQQIKVQLIRPVLALIIDGWDHAQRGGPFEMHIFQAPSFALVLY